MVSSQVPVPLSGLDPGDPRFGGKAQGLARLLRVGAAVPDGFAILATTAPPSAWPGGFREEVLRRVDLLLRDGPIAVRSSALGEDGDTRSFAGLFETRLGVNSAGEFWEAAGACVASGGSDRVLSYALREDPVPVGLIVMKMVPAVAAGVCFTRDPGGSAALVVEAVAGLGDGLVAGHVTPQRFAVFRDGLGRDEVVSQGPAGPMTPGDPQLAALIADARRLETALGQPLDLEWAIDTRGTLQWLQARPITAIAPPDPPRVERITPGVDDGPVTVWSNWNLRETMPEPFTPMGWSLWRNVVLPVVTADLFGFPRHLAAFPHALAVDRIQGRLYFNLNGVLAMPGIGRLVPRILSTVDATAGALVTRLSARGILTARTIPGRRFGVAVSMVIAGVRSNLGLLRNVGAARCLRLLREEGARVDARPDVRGLGDEALCAEFRLLAAPETAVLRRGLQMMVLAMFAWAVAEWLFRDEPEARGLLAVGLPGNPTTGISVTLDVLAEAARPLAAIFAAEADPTCLLARLEADPDGRAWLDGFRNFLARDGHRGPGEFDFAAPRWADDPAMPLGVIRMTVLSPPREGMGSRLLRLYGERQAAIEAAVTRAPWWKRPLLRAAARAVEAYMPLRETPKHEALRIFLRTRRAIVEAGARLVARGVLGSRDDVYFLEEGELRTLLLAGGSAPDLGTRRAEFEGFRARKGPDFLRSDGVPVEEVQELSHEPGVYLGAGVSRGVGRGPVRVLRTPDPSAMADGDVLVGAFAAPGGPPLSPRAAAIVMEVGGTMCPAAVVARELGSPAVFGIRGATGLWEVGAQIVVDGAQGRVWKA